MVNRQIVARTNETYYNPPNTLYLYESECEHFVIQYTRAVIIESFNRQAQITHSLGFCCPESTSWMWKSKGTQFNCKPKTQ